MTTTEPDLYYEPFDAACKGDRFAIYAELRDRAPVYRAPSGLFVVSRFDDVLAVLSDTVSFSSRPNHNEAAGFPASLPEPGSVAYERLMPIVTGLPLDPAELLASPIIVATDPPHHNDLRKLVNRAFTPVRVADLRARIDSMVTECLSGMDERDCYEVVAQLAGVLPSGVMSELLALDDAHRPYAKKWAEDLVAGAQSSARGTVEGHARLLGMVREVADYFVPLIETRRRHPTGDLVSAIAAGEKDDSLTPAETVLFVVVLITAGTGSTGNLIGNTIVSLLQNRDQLEILAQRPELIPSAVEESIRYRTPFQFIFREAIRDVELRGVPIPKGSIITVLTGSANHDPRRFDHPERFDVQREPAHIGFGRGPHFCLGANLARAQGIAVLQQLVPRLSEWELAENGLDEFPGMLDLGYTRIDLVRAVSA